MLLHAVHIHNGLITFYQLWPMINVAISLRFAGSYGRPRMIESGTGQFHHAEALSKVLSFILQIGQTSWVLIRAPLTQEMQ